MRRLSMAIFSALLVLAADQSAYADAGSPRAREVMRILADADQQTAHGKRGAAVSLLRKSLARHAGETPLLARYAELTLPFDGELGRGAEASAQELLKRIARGEAVPGHHVATSDPESERRLQLHRALAEALRGDDERAFALVVEAGHLQDAATIACLRAIATSALVRDRLLVAEQALGLARQYLPQDTELARELGHVLLARGKAEVALQVLSEWLAVEPRRLAARMDVAYAMTAAGRASEGLSLLEGERAACLAELSCALLGARVALEADRPLEALAYAEPHAAQGELEALYVAADAQQRTGQRDAARASYQRILALRPQSVRAKSALEQLEAH